MGPIHLLGISLKKMLSLAAFVALLAVSSALRVERNDLWSAYKQRHGKYYSVREEILRREIYESNLDYIEHHNIQADNGLSSYRMGESQYTDWTNDEFRAFMNGYVMRNTSTNMQFVPTNMDPPSSMDWRTKGYVTKVKNQERCGSCWAFSTTGSLEGQHFKKSNSLVSLSEQQLVDCSAREGNKGCKGGIMENGFKYIIKNKGIDTEESYPYRAVTEPFCKAKEGSVGATMSSFVDIKRGSIEGLQQALATIGPISVAMDASHMSFQHYKTGVYDEPKCSSIKLDHGVLAVGYGGEGGQEYWIIKNSWGTVWGDEGYFKIVKSSRNMCGIATQATYPVV